ncbi:MAG: hypothetical protein GC160_05960 [Acidobacteria bacterium]|nr:hypothetical protein [Acidobacteriota bacterium]
MNIRDESGSIAWPGQEFQRTVASLARRLESPVERLAFSRRALAEYQRTPSLLRASPLARFSEVVPALEALASCRRHKLRWNERALLLGWRLWRFVPAAPLHPRRAAWVAGALLAVSAVALAPSLSPPEAESPAPAPAAAKPARLPGAAEFPLEVWLVETQQEMELYSNGLQVSNEFLVHGDPRSYVVLPAGAGSDWSAALEKPDVRSRPAGIVFHTTVSEVSPPLEREQNQLIRYRGRQLLRYLAREKLYHFVIDRFGRVYRLLPESEVAYHAGFSVWEHAGEQYFNLNDSFLGVAFETRPEALDSETGPEAAVTPAQVAAAAQLTRMLRDTLSIPEGNCVTHEMISLNPNNHLIGYHTDWAGLFPFEQIGLPAQYETPLPSVAHWGFRFDDDFVAVLGGRPFPGMTRAERRFREEAYARGLDEAELRRRRAAEYRRITDALGRLRRDVRPDGARGH